MKALEAEDPDPSGFGMFSPAACCSSGRCRFLAVVSASSLPPCAVAVLDFRRRWPKRTISRLYSLNRIIA